MPDPEWSRKELKRFLNSNTDLYEKTRRRIARQELKEDFPLHEVDEASVTEYLSKNWDAIEQKTNELIDDTCKKIIPGSYWRYLVSQLGVLSIFLGTPIIALSCCIVLLFKEQVWAVDRIGLCIGSILLLAGLLIASAFAVLTERKRKL